MNRFFSFLIVISFSFTAAAQEQKLYNPRAEAAKDIEAVIKKAASENKHVLIQAGNNQCGWCIEFARFSKATPRIDSIITAGYVLYHLNLSKENENKNIFAQYGFPQRFGFPVFVILNGKGERIHTQNSLYLEEGTTGYNPDKVQSFLESWAPRALDPSMYGN